MDDDPPEAPTPPDLPKYLREPLERQGPDRLEAVAEYARDLAAWKRDRRRAESRRRRATDAVDDERLERLAERGVSTDPGDYEDVPDGAYVTIKTTKRSGGTAYRYFYWQWREGQTWENEYIAPVTPRE